MEMGTASILRNRGQEQPCCRPRLHIVARSLQERRIALLMRGASPRRRAPAATCCPEPRLSRLQPATPTHTARDV